ncbi:MAG TPA: hypothetical protein DCX34_03540, partial [Roseovarius sp.]|nr:hypothetical protein [Roseovarius sp.]
MRSSDTLAMLRALGTRVQLSGWVGGGFAFLEEANPPDADALRINAAVQRLDDLVIDRDAVGMTDDAAFAEMSAEERDAAYAAGRARVLDADGRFRSSLAAFVIAGAVLRRPRPVRLAEPVKRVEVAAPNGTRMWFRTVMQSAGAGRPAFPVEVSGFNHSRQRPYPGAYRKFRL